MAAKSSSTPAKVREEIERLKEKFNFKEPLRAHIDDPGCEWRFGSKPDYSVANLHFLKGKTQNHAEGSLEQIVEDLVKTWEMEASHKSKITDWTSIVLDEGVYHISANNWRKFDKDEALALGNYNVLMSGCPKSVWDAENTTYEHSHELFLDSMEAFPWEVLRVLTPPPSVAFSWRHWGHFTGHYKGFKGQGQLVEMYGFGIAKVNDALKLEDLNIYYEPVSFIEVLEGKKDAKELALGKPVFGEIGCPYILKV